MTILETCQPDRLPTCRMLENSFATACAYYGRLEVHVRALPVAVNKPFLSEREQVSLSPPVHRPFVSGRRTDVRRAVRSLVQSVRTRHFFAQWLAADPVDV